MHTGLNTVIKGDGHVTKDALIQLQSILNIIVNGDCNAFVDRLLESTFYKS